MPGTRPGTTTVHRKGKVTVRIARPMGRRTCDVFLLSESLDKENSYSTRQKNLRRDVSRA